MNCDYKDCIKKLTEMEKLYCRQHNQLAFGHLFDNKYFCYEHQQQYLNDYLVTDKTKR